MATAARTTAACYRTTARRAATLPRYRMSGSSMPRASSPWATVQHRQTRLRLCGGVGLASTSARSVLRPPYRQYVTKPAPSSELTEADVEAMLPTLEELGVEQGDRVTVAVSGGVDSSVTLAILARMPLEVDVVFMRNWDALLSESEPSTSSPLADLSYSPTSPSSAGKSTCSWEQDWRDVQAVCAHLSIPKSKVRLMDFSKEYWSRVFEPSVAVWEAGGTPNPDVLCNREIKFGALLDAVIPGDGKGHYLATGHYARVKREGSEAGLYRAVDPTKDQSYYLSAVTGRQLDKMVTPLGSIAKKDVRRLARYFGLPTADRAESMGVCFIGERGNFGDFVAQYTQSEYETPGHLVLADGTVLGEHAGLWHYTIGQRARVAGQDKALFVAKKGVGKGGRDVLVVPGSDHPALRIKRISTSSFHLNTPASLADTFGGSGQPADVQIRHRMKAVPAHVRLAPADELSAATNRTGAQGVVCEFTEPVVGVAPGQVAAVYLGERCIGSGVIEETWSEVD